MEPEDCKHWPSQFDSFTGNLSSILFALLFRDQAGNSLPGSQFPAKHHTKLRKRFSELAGFEEVGRIPRATRKLQLRARVSLKQQDTFRTKSSCHLRKERSLHILNAQNQIVAALREFGPLKIRLRQLESAMERPRDFMEALTAAHTSAHAVCARFQNI